MLEICVEKSCQCCHMLATIPFSVKALRCEERFIPSLNREHWARLNPCPFQELAICEFHFDRARRVAGSAPFDENM